MAKAEGTVTVLDTSATTYSRTWCGYEIFVSLIDCCKSGKHYSYDIYTLSSSGAAVGLTDGLAAVDKEGTDKPWEQSRQKLERERAFPLTLAAKALNFKIQAAEATMAADRRHILNRICHQGSCDLDAEPPENHPAYKRVNHLLRGRVAVGVWRIALEAGHKDMALFSKAVSRSGLHELHLELTNCRELRSNLDLLVRALPSSEESCKLTLNLCHTDLGSDGAEALCSGIARQRQLTSMQLFAFGNFLGPAGAEALGASVGQLWKLRSLTLFLFSNDVCAEGASALSAGLGRLQQLSSLTLNLDDNSIGPRGAAALGPGLSCLQELSDLRLSLKRNGIGGVGAKALLTSLSKLLLLNSLELDLEGNRLGADDGGGFDGAQLGGLRRLKRLSLNLNGNALRDGDIQALSAGLGELQLLSALNLDMRGNVFTHRATDALRDSIGRLQLQDLMLDFGTLPTESNSSSACGPMETSS